MINSAFLRETYSQYRIKALENELEQFKSGEKYISMKEAHRKEVQALRSENKKLAEQLAQARRTTKEVREKWFSTCDELDRNDRRELEKAFRQIENIGTDGTFASVSCHILVEEDFLLRFIKDGGEIY